ncbi:MAG: AtpZ/AtpI family protein [Anaerolineae bacterium]|nr:AtpZ/AtpI family protein [Anaerolineae bacterium]MDW8099945.1 AtpZ/AtpI family protein [Anaerolineae bacterium]
MACKHPVLAFVLHLSVVVIVLSAIPLALGIWADRRFEMAPWLTLVGMLVGVMAASMGIWRMVQRRYAKLERRGRDDGIMKGSSRP